MFDAIQPIVLADVITRLDNILAVGGAAHGNLTLLLFGLALNMPIIMFGSNFVAMLMGRLPWLIYPGSAILAYTVGEMIFRDRIVGEVLPHSRIFEWLVIIALVGNTLGLAYWLNRRQRAAQALSSASTGAADNTAASSEAQRHPWTK